MSSPLLPDLSLFVLKDPPQVPVEQLTKFLLALSHEFDTRSQAVFLGFLQTNARVLNLQQAPRKVHVHLLKVLSEKLGNFQKKNAKMSLLRASFKPLKREVEVENRKIPPRTKIYINLNYSLRIDERQTLESMIGPRSLDNLCGENDFEIFEVMKRNTTKLTPIQLSSVPKLVFFVKKFQEAYGLSLHNIRTLSAFLDIDVTTIAYYWLEQAKKGIQEPKKKAPPKIYTQKYPRFFCNICLIYACNIHFSNKDDPLEEDDNNQEFSSFYNFINPPKKQLFQQNFRENQVNWVSVYRCHKELNSHCYRNLHKEVDPSLVETVNLKKYQREIIDHCMTYNNITPCFLYLLCKTYNPNENTPCLAFYIYIMQNDILKKRDEFQRNLKSAIELEKLQAQERAKNPMRKKRGPKNQQPPLTLVTNANRDAEFMEYIPCFHDGECNEDNCYCVKNRGYCEKYCCCSLFCELKFGGCHCPNGDCFQQNCECFQNQRECDPDVCLHCNVKNNSHFLERAGVKTMPFCKNSNLTYKVKRRLVLGKSTICDGLGIFAGQIFKKGDFIGEYVGEMLNFEEAEKRGRVYSLMNVYYLFTLNNNNVKHIFTNTLLFL